MCQTDGCIDFPRIFVIWLAFSSKLLKPAFQKLPRLHERILQMKTTTTKFRKRKNFSLNIWMLKCIVAVKANCFALIILTAKILSIFFVIYKYSTTRFNQLWNGPEEPKIWIKAILFSPEKELISLQAYETFGWDQSWDKESYQLICI